MKPIVDATSTPLSSIFGSGFLIIVPILAGTPGEATLSFERSSDLTLVLAYVISVCLYVHILAAFVLGGFHADSELNAMVAAALGFITVFAVPAS